MQNGHFRLIAEFTGWTDDDAYPLKVESSALGK